MTQLRLAMFWFAGVVPGVGALAALAQGAIGEQAEHALRSIGEAAGGGWERGGQ